jgi:hypothetical protein
LKKTNVQGDQVEKFQELIKEDSRRTIHELTDTAGISYGVCQETSTENLKMRHNAPLS